MADDYLKRRKALHASYSLWIGASDGCAYCGVPADTYDHVPSLSRLDALGRTHFDSAGVRLFLVPACRECNCLLSMSNADSLPERKREVKAKLKKRYNKFIKRKHWTSDELSELGYNLRTLIEGGDDISEWVRRRLSW